MILHRARVRNFARIFLFLPFFLSSSPLLSLVLFFRKNEQQCNVLRGPRNETRSGEREREREIVTTSSRKEEKIRTSAGERMKPYLRSRIRRNLIILGYFFIFIERDDSRYFIQNHLCLIIDLSVIEKKKNKRTRSEIIILSCEDYLLFSIMSAKRY